MTDQHRWIPTTLRYQGEPVVTFAMTDALHDVPEGSTRLLFLRSTGPDWQHAYDGFHFYSVRPEQLAGSPLPTGRHKLVVLTFYGFVFFSRWMRTTLGKQVIRALVDNSMKLSRAMSDPGSVWSRVGPRDDCPCGSWRPFDECCFETAPHGKFFNP